ncbi:MAG: biopolymer transport protein TolR [Acidobacteriota bacterium]|jgi:biopolymer transport protein TolR|nr:biopolymer transport protein TolR [Acidobacteriota bacterium]
MGMTAGKGGGAVPYINVTPLIDVLLVLLIIFMVVTPLKPKRFKTQIPEPPTQEQQQATAASNRILRVDILKGNADDPKIQLFHDVGGQMVAEEMGSVEQPGKLGATLSGILKRRETEGPYKVDQPGVPDKTVFIKAPKGLPYGAVVKVIDAAKGAGAEPVGLQIDALEK